MKETMIVGTVFLVLVACGEGTKVESPYPATVAVSPETAEFDRFRATEELTATVRDQDGNIMDAVVVTWSTEDADVAEVSATGVVTAVGSGVIKIVATAGEVSGSAGITVRLPQRDWLIALYESLNGDSWNDNGNWRTKTELTEWSGVETDADGNVTQVNLADNNLVGELPAGIAVLEHLVELELNLPCNGGLTGVIPPGIGELKKLRALRSV